MILADILTDVAHERERQDSVWGPNPRAMDLGTWITVLGEEYGEVCNASLERMAWSAIRSELVQVAAVAVAAIEDMDWRHAPVGDDE